MATWQHAVFFNVGGEQLPLDLDETREIIAKLREPDRGNPHMADAQLAGAIFLERLIDEPDAVNPELTRREMRAVALAITRLEITDGLSQRQEDLRNALFQFDMNHPE